MASRSRSAASSCRRRGGTATTSSTPSTATCRSTASSASRSPATCCPRDSLAAEQRQLVATTFLALGNTNLEEQDKKQLGMDVVDEQLDTIGKAFLGQTIGCARCHDHKFDPIPTGDYYALAGILRNAKALEHANVSKWIEVPLPLPADEEDRARRGTRRRSRRSKQNQIDELKAADRKAGARYERSADQPSSRPRTCPASSSTTPQAKKVGEWKDSQHSERYIGAGYVHDENAGKGEKTLTFQPEPAAKRHVRGPARLSSGPSRADERAGHRLQRRRREGLIQVDKRKPPPIDGRFVSLGEYRFEKSRPELRARLQRGRRRATSPPTPCSFIPSRYAPTRMRPQLQPRQKRQAQPSDTAKEAGVARAAKRPRNARKAGPKRPMAMTVVEGKEDRGQSDPRPRQRPQPRRARSPAGSLQVATIGPAPTVPANAERPAQLADWIASTTTR